ncbi:TonB-dependent receptor [Halioxenophilus sp. WMMB6]|uniref:TonB-dependent receptor n=1 Tax=Halioxenophilus sp. WMMB6 TaxID=3073815 RepID=UPI00295EC002|nr:TonB-dependent receptor [Halioxenophilus sp. WMMB6]
MLKHNSKKLLCVAIASVTLNSLSTNSYAVGDDLMLEEIVVTARRRDESLQDVPLTVNVVGADDLADNNIRHAKDLQGLVAGLTLAEDPIAPNASLRGVRFDAFASGFNPTVEFYLNDSPVVSSVAMQALFDVGQIEVLRGPQGTLRGRASPSGSITITTKRPDYYNFDAYVDVTGSDADSENVRAAVNLPLIEEILAVRLAGFYETNNNGDIESTTSGVESDYEGDGYRVSVAFAPVDSFEANLMYQRLRPERTTLSQVESGNLADSSISVSSPIVRAGDRKATSTDAQWSFQDMQRTNLEMRWDVGPITANYAGSITDQTIENLNPEESDPAGYFNNYVAQGLDKYRRDLVSDVDTVSHELRFSPSEYLFDGKLTFVVGGLMQENQSKNDLLTPTAVFFDIGPAPGFYLLSVNTQINTHLKSTEESLFGNVTYFITDDTEFSLGVRQINFELDTSLDVGGNRVSQLSNDWDDTIYSASLKHSFTDNFLAYASYGTSWRPGISAVGNFSVAQSDREKSFQNLEPETSDSIELGIKSEWLDNKLRLNVAAFHQTFDNFPYRSGGSGVNFVSTSANTATDPVTFNESVASFNFVAAVPVEVNGIEIESSYQATEQLAVGAMLAWSKGEIDNGVIPCNDYNPADGSPDSTSAVPTVAEIRAATGGDNVGACAVTQRANFAPLWTMTLQSEYTFGLLGQEGYVRGLATFYGDSQNDPSNALDDVDAYNTVNLYTGVRSADGHWEAMLFAKNLFDTERVIRRDTTLASASYVSVNPADFSSSGQSGTTDYRRINTLAPREIGVNLRYNF